MKMIAQILSWISLVVLIVPSVLFLAGKMSSLDQVKWVMLLATIFWFVTASLWMWKESD